MSDYKNYVKKTWANGETITANSLNNIENGIKNLETEALDRIDKVEETSASVLQNLNGTPMMLIRDKNGVVSLTEQKIVNFNVNSYWYWGDTKTIQTITIPANNYKLNTVKEEQTLKDSLSILANLKITFGSYSSGYYPNSQMLVSYSLLQNNIKICEGIFTFKSSVSANKSFDLLSDIDNKTREKIRTEKPELTLKLQITDAGYDTNYYRNSFTNISIVNTYAPFYSYNDKGQLLNNKGEVIE